MNEDKEIFLPDTTIKLKNLKSKLSEVYGLDVVSKKERIIYFGIIIALGSIVLYQTLKK